MSTTQEPLYTLPLPTTLGATSVTWVSPPSIEKDILLAAGGIDRLTHVFSIPSIQPDISNELAPKELYTLHGHTAPVSSVLATPSGREVLSASWDGSINLYTIPQDPELISEHQTIPEPISYLAQRDLKKRRNIGTASTAGNETIEGLTDGETGLGGWRRLPDSVWRGHKGRVGALGYGGNGVVYSGGWDGSVRGWDVETGENIVMRVCPYFVLPSSSPIHELYVQFTPHTSNQQCHREILSSLLRSRHVHTMPPIRLRSKSLHGGCGTHLFTSCHEHSLPSHTYL